MADTTSTAKIKVEIVNEAQVIRSLNNINGIVAALNRKKIKIDIDSKDTMKASEDIGNLSEHIGGLKDTAQGATKESGKLGKTLSSIGSIIKNKLINGAINAVVNSFKAAYTEIAAVDNELAKIQRDSGASSEEMEKLGKSAYDAAQKYGVFATEYLKSVGMFSKSDYKGAADQLGELALRTQIAGDMSAEAASDFLLAADAAFGYEGSISQLSALVDKADSIDDKFGITMQETAA